MTDNTPQTKSSFPLSRILRFSGFAILLIMLISSVVFQFMQPEVLTDEEIVAATVQAEVDLGLTEVSVLTGTPDAAAIQSTVDSGIEATLTQIAIDENPTQQPETSNTDDSSESVDGVISWIMNLFGSVFGIIVSAWEFAGRGGIFVQVCCCIAPFGLIVIGILND